MKRLFTLIVALMALTVGASAEELSVTYKAGEVRLNMSQTERNVFSTLMLVGEFQVQETVGDGILVYNKAGNKLLMTVTTFLTVADDVAPADNIEHVLTAADWTVLDAQNATLAQTLRSQNVEKVSMLFRGSTATEEVNIEIADDMLISTMGETEGYCFNALRALQVLQPQQDGDKMVYARNGKSLFYMGGESPETGVFKICDGVTTSDNFTYELTTEDRETLDEMEMPGSAGKTLGELLETVKSISMTFVGVPEDTSFDPYTTPLTFEATKDNTTVTVSNPQGLTIEYSINSGSSWTSSSATSIAIDQLAAGTKVCLRGNNAAYVTSDGNPQNATNITFDKDCYVYGNVMSLISSTGYATLTTLTGTNAFQSLFWNNEHFVSHNTKNLVLPATTLTQGCYLNMFTSSSISRAPELPATTVTRSCYQNMFTACKNLKAAPALPATTMEQDCYYGMFESCIALKEAPALPATELDWNCYDNMFRNCTALTKAPELPATTLAYGCYEYMFGGCTSLETAPALPATTLAERCYESMFYLCSALVNAPELPATTLADLCYASMFYGCSSLEKAPELPAPTLVTGCYNYMFGKCTKLNYVKCLATDLSVNSSDKDWLRGTNEWLYGVAATGTFVKAEGVNAWTTGTSGIPTGWTVESASTGMESLTTTLAQEEKAWYTLDGRKVNAPLSKGVYIVGGRKIIVK